jgi:hypothetical protein
MGKKSNMGDINEFWIINEGGLCLYNIFVGNESSLDSGLFGGFVTAIDRFGENLANNNIQKLNFGKNLIVFKKNLKNNLLFVASTIKSSEKKLRKILHEIEGKFLVKYSDDLISTWDGDLSVFEGFSEEIKRLIRSKKL